jgi:5-methylcytosine-specific restriction endonuclease McrA
LAKTPEQLARYVATRKEKLHAVAIAAGRDPTLIGRPPKVTADQKREKRRLKDARLRARRKAARIAAGIVSKPPGPKPLPEHERVARRQATFVKSRKLHLENLRKYQAEWWRKKRAAKAIAEGRVPGVIGRLSSMTVDEMADYLRKWRGDDRKFILQIKTQNYRAKKMGVAGEITVADIIRIFGEQCGCCAYCGYAFGDALPEIDHWVPLAKNGHNEPTNIKLLHRKCNRTKGARHPPEMTARVAAP